MFEVRHAESRESLREALREQQAEIAAYFDGLSEQEFFAEQGEHWSPAGHLRHLNKAIRALAGGLGQKKLVLLTFGRSKGGSRTYDEVVAQYREALDAGAQAGPFGPSSKVPEMTAEEWRRQIMGYWSANGEELRESVLRWDDEDLDRYRLPHPLMGKLTLREMLYFTLYHNAHHASRVAERRTAQG